jgi:hypothetical protein
VVLMAVSMAVVVVLVIMLIILLLIVVMAVILIVAVARPCPAFAATSSSVLFLLGSCSLGSASFQNPEF